MFNIELNFYVCHMPFVFHFPSWFLHLLKLIFDCSVLIGFSLLIFIILVLLPSVLWHCWLGGRKGIRPVKNRVVGFWCVCLERGADLHMAQLMSLSLTVSCFSKIQIGFTFLIPAHLGSSRKRAVKRVSVCLYSLLYFCLWIARGIMFSTCLSVCAYIPAFVRAHRRLLVFFCIFSKRCKYALNAFQTLKKNNALTLLVGWQKVYLAYKYLFHIYLQV